jgi:metallopeptidase MepB
MKLFGNLLQLRFSPLSGDDLRRAAVWHEDVEGWCVWDDRPTFKGDFIGYLYADLLGRPNKYHGSQSVNLQRVSTAQNRRREGNVEINAAD